jgi:DNA-binding MarR family transcriptional regulator
MQATALALSRMEQKFPTLFDDQQVTSPEVATIAGKTLIDRLLKLRRNLSIDEQHLGLGPLNALIDDLRARVRATPSQREEMVLYAIERQGATTRTEISEDTRIHREIVDQLVEEMVAKDLLYIVPRHVPGSDRPQFAIKSRRAASPEVDEVIKRPESRWEKEI